MTDPLRWAQRPTPMTPPTVSEGRSGYSEPARGSSSTRSGTGRSLVPRFGSCPHGHFCVRRGQPPHAETATTATDFSSTQTRQDFRGERAHDDRRGRQSDQPRVRPRRATRPDDLPRRHVHHTDVRRHRAVCRRRLTSAGIRRRTRYEPGCDCSDRLTSVTDRSDGQRR